MWEWEASYTSIQDMNQYKHLGVKFGDLYQSLKKS